jgi:hypothetical protein
LKKIPHTYRKPINHSVDGPNIAGPVNDLDYLNADAGDVYTTPSMTPVTIPEDRLKNLLNQNGNNGVGSWTNPNEQINPITGERLSSLKTFSTPTADELAQANAPDYWMPTQSLLDSFAGMFYPTEDVPDCPPDSEFVKALPDSVKGLFRNKYCPPNSFETQATGVNGTKVQEKSNRNLFIGLGIGLAVIAIVGTVIIVNRKSKAA